MPHIRAARALLDGIGNDLADETGTSFSTIKRLEKDEGLVKIDTLDRVKATLEEAGLRFARDSSSSVLGLMRAGEGSLVFERIVCVAVGSIIRVNRCVYGDCRHICPMLVDRLDLVTSWLFVVNPPDASLAVFFGKQEDFHSCGFLDRPAQEGYR